jgi:dTDP-4-dehydrorhamnose 3,5-epimerase
VIFSETLLPGVLLIDPEPNRDERGSFARLWCRHEFAERGLCAEFDQISVSCNTRRGTVRGLHFQAAPHEETKLVRCNRGALYDVVVDLRRDSPRFGRWFAAELTVLNQRMLYIPPGLAHGFQTLEDDTEVLYLITPAYVPAAARGVRWNDPAIGIDWPIRADITISDRDAQFPCSGDK